MSRGISHGSPSNKSLVDKLFVYDLGIRRKSKPEYVAFDWISEYIKSVHQEQSQICNNVSKGCVVVKHHVLATSKLGLLVTEFLHCFSLWRQLLHISTSQFYCLTSLALLNIANSIATASPPSKKSRPAYICLGWWDTMFHTHCPQSIKGHWGCSSSMLILHAHCKISPPN